METTDAIVIVGTGLAGYTVAREVRKLDANVPLVLISESDGCFYSKPTLSNALAMKKQPTELALFDASAMAMQLNACVLTHRSVERIAPDGREIVVGGEPLSYARLVLAIGADARRVPMQGDGASDVLSVNSLADYARFRERLQSAQSVAILGAGLIGCEFANDLALAGYRVSLVDPAAAPLSRLVPEPIGVALAAAREPPRGSRAPRYERHCNNAIGTGVPVELFRWRATYRRPCGVGDRPGASNCAGSRCGSRDRERYPHGRMVSNECRRYLCVRGLRGN
jgi:NAD(P)H-nitrite reductase large subunit